MNLAINEETKYGRIEEQRRTSNMNAFKYRLASVQKRWVEGVPTQHEETVRQQILDGLIADKGGDEQISTATRILAEVIASDAAWLMVFNVPSIMSTLRPRNNHPFVLNPALPGERLFVPQCL